MKNIDFLPDVYCQACRQRATRVRRLGLAAMALCLLACWFAVDELRVRRTRGQLEYLVRQNDTVQAGLEQIARLQAEQSVLLDKYQLLQDLQPPASSVGTLFRVAQLLPEHIALRQLQMVCSPAGSATPDAAAAQLQGLPAAPVQPKICLSGIALSQVDIAVLVGQLSGCREFANVRLDYSKAAEVESRQVQEFRVTFDVLGQAAASQLASGV